MPEANLEQEELDAVKTAAEALNVVWKSDPPSPGSMKRMQAAVEHLETVFPGYPRPEELIFDDEMLRARPIDDILADLRHTGPFPLQHPLWERLWNAAGETVGTTPSARTDFDPVGLNLYAPPLKCGIYLDSPLNAVEFAATGGDGDHFSLLPVNGTVGSDSPVVLTMPSDASNIIVAGNLDEFLRVGLHCGFFQYLENFSKTFANRIGWWFGDDTDVEQQQLLRRLANQLGLEPISPARVDRQALKTEILPLLRFRGDAI